MSIIINLHNQLFFCLIIVVVALAAIATIVTADQEDTNNFHPHVEAAINKWNLDRDHEIIKSKDTAAIKTTPEYTRHEQMMRAFTAEVPDGELLDRNMKKYEFLRHDIQQRVSKPHKFYPFLSNQPEQVHIALTQIEGNVSVMWTTANTSTGSQVCYRPVQQSTSSSSSPFVCTRGTSWTYHPISDLPWFGTIHSAYMTGLVPGSYFEYYVGDPDLPNTNNNTKSKLFTFKAPQLQKEELYAYVGGDMGTVQLCGHLTAAQMKTDLATRDAQNPPDAFFLIGDIAYSTLDPPHSSFEFFWDWFLSQEQDSLSGAIPLMVSAGNHDSAGGDWGAFRNRFQMPHNKIVGEGNFYWALEMGPILYISMCTEPSLNPAVCEYHAGSKQFNWIEEQLKNVDRSRTPWVIMAGHRPVLSSDLATDSGELPNDIGPLFKKYGVDAFLCGHMHEHELAIWPAINGTKANLTGVTKISGTSWRIHNPELTTVITAGALGAVIEEKFITPQPEWSLARGGTFWTGEENYGYAAMKATKTTLHFEFRAQKSNTTLWEVLITK